MRLGRCKRCGYGDPAIDGNGSPFVICRALPERPIVIGEQLHWVFTPKARNGWCGLFRLSFWKTIKELFKGNGA